MSQGKIAMYQEFFGISDKPFQITPDPRFLYLTSRHRDGLAHLLYGADEAGGFILLTGEVGTGKTMLCRSVLEQMPEHVNIALILNPRQNSRELLASICDELNIPYRKDTKSLKYLVDRLNLYLLKEHAQGKRTVLVIDEAQNLRAEVLEQIRLLTNLEVSTQKLLQIILIGQPELQAILARPELRQLTQRITARFHLTPLSREETSAYIRHRLQIVGFKGELFSPGAMNAVHKITGGVPRLINNVCERALIGAYGENVHRIDQKMVRSAASEVLQPKERLQPNQWIAGGAIAAGAAALMLAGWGFIPKTSQESYANANQESVATKTVNTQSQKEIPAKSVIVEKQAIEKDIAKETFDNSRPHLEVTEQKDKQLAKTTAMPVFEEKNSLAPSLHRPDQDGKSLFISLIDDENIRADNHVAFNTLFSYWGVGYTEAKGNTACERATAVKLACIFGKAGWEEVRIYNRPVVLELINKAGKRKQVVVLALQGKQVSLNIGGRVVTTSIDTVDPFWYGNYLLLWRPPPTGSILLKEGVISADVGWLRDQLDKLDGKPIAESGKKKLEFDPNLKWRVMEFQRIRGLKVDGVVGRETMIDLSTAVNDRSTPLLSRQSS